MKTSRIAFALAALAWLAPTSPAQKLVNLPVGSWANDVTPDGEIVVGTSFVGGFIWRWRVDPEPTYVTGGDMVAVSDDGSVVLGNIIEAGTGNQLAALWTEAGGWDPLPVAGSCDSFVTNGYGLSGDGKSATGLAWAAGCDARGFLWTEANGLQLLDSLGFGTNRASAISRDGQVLGGFAQGSFNRTPAVWSTDLTGTLYDIDAVGEVHGFDNDGSVVVGEWNGNAFFDDGSGITVIGKLFSGITWKGIATDISEDGQTISGYDVNGNSRSAWMWTPADGIKSMNQVMFEAGFPGVPSTLVSRAMSDDGNVIVGGNVEGGGGPFGFGAFIFERNSIEVWEDVGHALAGANGEPRLSGFGSLEAGSVVTMVLSDGLRNGSTFLVVGLSQLNAPFKGGVLVPEADFVHGPLLLDGAGELSVAAHWPAGVPSGATTYFQHWIADIRGPVGFAASNAVAGTSP